MRLVFAGTPDAAVPTLRALHAVHDIVAVVTRPDAPLGRKRVLTPSPVAAVAEELGLPVIKAARLDAEVTAQITALQPELGVIVAYGGLVREPLLSAPAAGWINLHFSTLPAWRGAAPVQRALIAGEQELGMSVFQLVAELDAGDVFASGSLLIPPTATAGEALTLLAEHGAALTRTVVADIAAGTARALPQEGEGSYAAKLSLEDGRLDWHEPAAAIWARFRGVTPEPGAFTTLDGLLVKVLDAAPGPEGATLAPGEVSLSKTDLVVGTGDGALTLRRVQPAGKAAMAASDWWRGQRGAERFGS